MSGKQKKERSGVRSPLVVKLIVIISVIVVFAMGITTGLSSWFFARDSRIRAEENNLTTSLVVAAQMESEIRGVFSGALSLLDTLRESTGIPGAARIHTSNYFDRNAEIACLILPGELEIFNYKFFRANELEPEIIRPFLNQAQGFMERARAGETLVVNASPYFSLPAAVLLAPYRDLGSPGLLMIFFSTESLQGIVQANPLLEIFAVDNSGELIAHPDFDLVRLGANVGGLPTVRELLGSSLDNGQMRYSSETGEEFLGAFRRIELGQLGVVTNIPLLEVHRAALNITRQNLYLTGIVLLFSILAVWFFSRSVTRPVLTLVQAAHRIEMGEFELDIRATTGDELGLLTKSFVNMGRGLAERERVKETFGKFVNKDIAERALRGDLELGGERKTATVFFSDIRSFTAISETMDPEDVVDFLNDYFTRMVDCIERTGGVVDKFIGDAIMAVWGSPVSKGSPEADALAAIEAMLLMRQSLREYNAERSGNRPHISIGCGVNTGPCLAGQIGSKQRMEFTVIGDTVNLASRIEQLNKPLGTDILISQGTYELVKNKIIAHRIPRVSVKGKKEEMSVYAVINIIDSEGPKNIAELRAYLGIPEPKMDADTSSAEKKYEIHKG